MSLHTSTSLAKAIGVTYRELDYWTREGFIKPTPVGGESGTTPGTGHTRIWDDRDAEVAHWFAVLVKIGMKPSKIRDLAERLADGRHAYLPGGIEVRRTVRPVIEAAQ